MNATAVRCAANAAADNPTLRIRRQPVEPMAALPLPLPRARGTTPPPVTHSQLDERLLAILGMPLRATETPTQCFDRKERDLGNAFFALTEDDAHALHRRLVINFACDLVARLRSSASPAKRLLTFLETHCCH